MHRVRPNLQLMDLALRLNPLMTNHNPLNIHMFSNFQVFALKNQHFEDLDLIIRWIRGYSGPNLPRMFPETMVYYKNARETAA